MEHFDLVVIGAGAAGLAAARTAAGLGARVALAERGPLGGLSSPRMHPEEGAGDAGRVHRLVRQAGGFGTFSGRGPARLGRRAASPERDRGLAPSLRHRAREGRRPGGARGGPLHRPAHRRGEWPAARRRALRHRGGLAAGGPGPAGPGAAQSPPTSSSSCPTSRPRSPSSARGRWPRLAGAFSDFGTRVTVLARDAEILPGVDPDVARNLRKRMEERGVAFRLRRP